MKEEAAVMVNENGLVVTKNFDSLSERKKHQLILGILLEYNNELASDSDQDEKDALEQKRLSSIIKKSKENRELQNIRKERADRKKRKERMLTERNGVLKVAKRMGLDLTNEIKKLKEIAL